jgi:hypothetical protein
MDRLPRTAGEIDAAWLGRALSGRHPGVRVARVEIVARHEATNGHARLRVGYDEAAGAPEAVFCKLLPSDPARRPAIAKTGMGRREALFYQRLAPTLAMRVPEVYFARCDERDGSFLLLLEDLVATGCRVPDGRTGVAPDAAARALEDLAGLHRRFEDPARRRAEAEWVPAPLHDPSYGATFLRHGLDRHRERLSHAYAEIAALYVARADALHALWQEGPTSVIHGDTHIGNLFDDGGRIGFLDWGIVSVDAVLRDASYFLCMALSVEDRRRCERDLLRHYLGALRAGGGTAIGFDAAWRAHRVHAAYTVVASCQVAADPDAGNEARRAFAAAFLARAEAAVADLESGAALREAGIG